MKKTIKISKENHKKLKRWIGYEGMLTFDDVLKNKLESRR